MFIFSPNNWLNCHCKPQEKSNFFNEKPVIDTGFPGLAKSIPFLSICIPTYNRAEMLPAAIESVLSQDFSDFELIICDNASTDNTAEVISGYKDPRIRYLRYTNLVSMYANHNRCINMCRADWVVFLHSDDVLISGSLKQVFGLLNSQEKGHFVQPTSKNCLEEKNIDLISVLGVTIWLPPSGCIYNRQLLYKVGLFTEDNILADWEVMLFSLLQGGHIFTLPIPIVKRNIHHNQSVNTMSLNGTSLIGGVNTIDKLFKQITEIQVVDLLLKFKDRYSSDKCMLLYRYLIHASRKDIAEKWKLILNDKFTRRNKNYLHALLSDILGFPRYLKLNILLRQFYHSISVKTLQKH